MYVKLPSAFTVALPPCAVGRAPGRRDHEGVAVPVDVVEEHARHGDGEVGAHDGAHVLVVERERAHLDGGRSQRGGGIEGVVEVEAARGAGARVADRGAVVQRLAGLGRGRIVRERRRHVGGGRHDLDAVQDEHLLGAADRQRDRADAREVGTRPGERDERPERHVDIGGRCDRGQDQARHGRVAGVGVDGEGQLDTRGRRGDREAEGLAGARQVDPAEARRRQHQGVGVAVPGHDGLATRVRRGAGHRHGQRAGGDLGRHRPGPRAALHRKAAVLPEDVRATRGHGRSAAGRVAQRGLARVEGVHRLGRGGQRRHGAQSQRCGQGSGAVRGAHDVGGHQRTCPATTHSVVGDGSLPSRPVAITFAPSMSQMRSPSDDVSSHSRSASPSPS